MKRNRGRLPKAQFPRILKSTIEDMPNLSSNIRAGFRGCGIVPLDRMQVMKRLPGFHAPEEENSAVNDYLVEFLKTMRLKDTEKAPRGKRISVTP